MRRAPNCTLATVEQFRFDVLSTLSFSYGDEPCEVHRHYLAIADAPSPVKDAISIGLLAGDLVPEGHGLFGRLELTALGRLAVRRFRLRIGMLHLPRRPTA